LFVAGFCYGGGQAFRFATNRPDLKGAFVFYGTPPDNAEMTRIKAPVYGFYGGMDARVTATVDPTKEKMKTVGKTYVPVIYDGAGHGFMRAGEDPGNKVEANVKARDEAFASWKEAMAKLSK
jgi:carboxymethylenebutenolidase